MSELLFLVSPQMWKSPGIPLKKRAGQILEQAVQENTDSKVLVLLLGEKHRAEKDFSQDYWYNSTQHYAM